MKKKDLQKFYQINKVTNKYITSAAISFSKQFSHITQEDLKQECMLKLIEVIKSNPKSSIDSIIQLYKTAIFNMMKDFYRKEKYRRTVRVTTSEAEEIEFIEMDIADDRFESNPENIIMFDHYCITIYEQLDDNTKKQFFKLLLYPDKELIDISSKYLQKNVERKNKTKKLVMNISRMKITYSHIAERLNISPSTASRHLQDIKNAVNKVIEES